MADTVKRAKQKMFAAQTTHSRFSFSRTKSALGSGHSFSRFFFSKCLSIQVKADVKHAVLSLSRTVPSFSSRQGSKKAEKALKSKSQGCSFIPGLMDQLGAWQADFYYSNSITSDSCFGNRFEKMMSYVMEAFLRNILNIFFYNFFLSNYQGMKWFFLT